MYALLIIASVMLACYQIVGPGRDVWHFRDLTFTLRHVLFLSGVTMGVMALESLSRSFSLMRIIAEYRKRKYEDWAEAAQEGEEGEG
jgi:hypothetical protein